MLEYCEHHRDEPLTMDEDHYLDDSRRRTYDISEWDQKFITMESDLLFELINAANYLDIKGLLYVTIPVI